MRRARIVGARQVIGRQWGKGGGQRALAVIKSSSLTIRTKDGVEEKTSVSTLWHKDEGFVAAVDSGDASGILSPYSDAVKTLAISIVVNKSAETAEPVAIAEV